MLDETLTSVLNHTETQINLSRKPLAPENDEGRTLLLATVAFADTCKELSGALEKKLDQAREQPPAVKGARSAALSSLLDELVSRHPV